jgi:hypothetical protein
MERPITMQNTKLSASLEAAWPMPKGLIWGLCVPAPIAGSILYYVWRNSHPEAARYANRASWVCWGTLIVAMLAVSSLAG